MPEESDSRRSGAEANPALSVNSRSWLSLEVVEECDLWQACVDVDRLVQDAGAALAQHRSFSGQNPAEACIALSDDSTVRDLNRRFRGKDKATNVLSFPVAGDSPVADSEASSLGDVILAFETVAREAREQGIPLAHHVQHLVVHGLLHLLGLDHETDAEASEMEELEIEILAALGIANPYCEEALPESR